MAEIAIKVENLGKSYRLGALGTATLKRDFLSMFGKGQNKKEDEREILWALKNVSFDIKKGDAV